MDQKRFHNLLSDDQLAQIQLRPDPDDPRLTRKIESLDASGEVQQTSVIVERPLTIYLNSHQLVTAMTIGDHPKLLALGYVLNQGLLPADMGIEAIEYHPDLDVVVIRTPQPLAVDKQDQQRTLTSGCAQGTAYEQWIDSLRGRQLPQGPQLKTSVLSALLRQIAGIPSLYREAGAIHGCALCTVGALPETLCYVEDVGRHNAVDKIAGFMHLAGIEPSDKLFFTTGRLTSEMVLKCVAMGVPILVSRSGLTQWGVELAQQFGLTMIARAKGKRFTAVSGLDRLDFDAKPDGDSELDFGR